MICEVASRHGKWNAPTFQNLSKVATKGYSLLHFGCLRYPWWRSFASELIEIMNNHSSPLPK